MASELSETEWNASTETAATESRVSCHETKPGRVVFTEAENSEGWIATDLTTPLER